MQRTGPVGGHGAVLKPGQGGFSLVEALCALAITSMVLLGSLHFFPVLHRQCHGAMLQMQLTRQLEQSVLSIEKDLRRAGYCSPPCPGPAVFIARRHGETPGSCVILRYAFYPADARKSGCRLINDTFGYRLHRGALETQRGVGHCDGPGWAKMHDTQRWAITQFQCEPLGDRAWRVTLAGAARGHPAITYRLSRVIAGRNG